MMKEGYQKYKESTIEWLLDSSNPSVRYRTLIDLKELPMDHPDVMKTYRAIQKSDVIRELLSHQSAEGHWRGPRGDVWEEKGTVFSLLLLAELGAEKSTKTEMAFNYLHRNFQLPSGRITYRPFKRITQKEQTSTWMWCITTVVLRAGLLLGHLDHPAIQNAIHFFEDTHNDEGGWYCSVYSKNPAKVLPPNCYMGTIKALRAFSAIPEAKRTKRIKSIISREIDTCLENEVCFYRVNPKGEPSLKRAWTKFAFPRYWRSDILEAVDVLTYLGVRDERLKKAIEIIQQKRQSDGWWLLDFSETKRAWIQIETEGLPSKWISLHALKIQKRLHHQ